MPSVNGPTGGPSIRRTQGVVLEVLGQAVGPLLISTLAGSAVQPETRTIFLLACAMSATLLVVAALIVPRGTESPHRGHSDGPVGGIRQLLRRPGLLQASCAIGSRPAGSWSDTSLRIG